MRKASSLKNLRNRDKDSKIVKRGKHRFLINKKKPKFKAKQ